MKRYLPSFSIMLCCLVASIASARDLPKSDPTDTHDSPYISRFAGSMIIGYESIDFDEMTMPLGRLNEDKKFSSSDLAKGRITRIAYVAPPEKSVLEISTNFEQALERAGFEKRFSCRGTAENEACGDAYDFSNALIPQRRLNGLQSHEGSSSEMFDVLRPYSGDVFVETARLNRPEGAVDVVLLVAGKEGGLSGIFLQICETKAMGVGQVSASAKGVEQGMAQGLAQQGHVALYGIHFSTDSAVISDDSASTLDQMVALMKSQPALKVYIVGHTDNAGALDHNLALSTQRAQAVVKALQDRGVPAGSMTAKGLASLAPVAPNATDEGKAKNRRVELVEQ